MLDLLVLASAPLLGYNLGSRAFKKRWHNAGNLCRGDGHAAR